MANKDWVISLDMDDDTYSEWKDFIKKRKIMYVGNQSPMRKIHSKLMRDTIVNLMNSSSEEIEAFFNQFKEEQ